MTDADYGFLWGVIVTSSMFTTMIVIGLFSLRGSRRHPSTVFLDDEVHGDLPRLHTKD